MWIKAADGSLVALESGNHIQIVGNYTPQGRRGYLDEDEDASPAPANFRIQLTIGAIATVLANNLSEVEAHAKFEDLAKAIGAIELV